MSVAENQRQIFLQLVSALQPHWRTDRALPERLNRLLARDRRFGSRDRRLYRELIYTALRFLPWIEPHLEHAPDRAAQLTAWLAADTRDTRSFREALLSDWPACPADLAAKATHLGRPVDELLPAWLRDECPAAFDPAEIDCLHRRAPLWLRLQTDSPDSVWADFDEHGWTYELSPVLPYAVRLPVDAGVTASTSYFSGAVEVQDLGSQFVLAAHEIQSGGRWLDACAGAGGKSLQLLRLVGPTGHVTATDLRADVLQELKTRAQRAGVSNLSIVSNLAAQSFDGVLLDAPCSGTGTWRRSPHLKWCTTLESVRQHADLQLQILQTHAQAVRSGGQLIYATCSLAESENEGVISRFLEIHPEFTPMAPARDFGFKPSWLGLTISPARHDTDGFFTCCLRRA